MCEGRGSNSSMCVSSSNRGSDGSMCVSSGNRGSDGSMCVSSNNGCSGNSVGGNGNGLVDGNMVLVNDGGLDNLVDGVDLVGLGNGIGLGNLNGVGFGNMFLNNDFSLDRDGDRLGDLNSVFVDCEFRNNSGHLGCDVSVGSDRGLDFGDGNGVSGCRSLVGGCWGNSIGKRGIGDDRGRELDSALRIFSRLSNVSVGSSLGDFRVLSILVSSLDTLGSNLDSSVSYNFMDSLGMGGSSYNMFSD